MYFVRVSRNNLYDLIYVFKNRIVKIKRNNLLQSKAILNFLRNFII